MHPLRFALRSLLKSPGFTAVAVLTMAVGIGANTALFSVYQSVVRDPLEFPRSNELVRVWTNDPARNFSAPASSWPKYEMYRDEAQSFTGVAGSSFHNSTLTRNGEAEQLTGLQVSPNFLTVLGLNTALGRNFTAEENAIGGPPVVILDHQLWQKYLGGRPGAVGETVVINNVSHTIVGILPESLPFPFNQTQYLVPRAFEVPGLNPEQVRSGGAIYLQITARLKPGVSFEQADAEVRSLSQRYNTAHPAQMDANSGHELRRFSDELFGNLRPTFNLLLIACAFVLLIACANVAALFQARLSTRYKEISVRLSMGATRGHIIRQFLTESLVFTAFAGALGIVASLWGTAAVSQALSNQLPRAADIAFSLPALTFSILASGLAALLVGFVPAVQASRQHIAETLKDTARSSAGGNSGRHFRNTLIVVEVALSVTLLVGAGLLVLSLVNLQRSPAGFNSQGVAAAFVTLPQQRYDTREKQIQFVEQVSTQLRAQPGVARAGAVVGVPLSGFNSITPYQIEGQPIVPLPQRPLAGFRIADPDYFATIGITLREGRFFEPTDILGGQDVVIVNESFAKRLWPGQSAVGKVILRGVNADTRTLVVGVIADVKSQSLAAPAPDEIFFPMGQRGTNAVQLVARTNGDPTSMQAAMRAAVAAVDGTIALSNFQTLDQIVAASLAVQRLLVWLLGAFAAVAFILAIVGLYSVLAYTVTQRTAEIGIRMALGAQRGQVVQLVMRQGLALVGLGLLAGLAVSAGATRLIVSQLYEVTPLNPVIYAGVCVAFAAVAALACLLPSLRAARVDPMIALRTE